MRTGRRTSPLLLAVALVVLWTQPVWSLQLVGRISDDQEVQVGKQAAAQVEKEYRLLRDSSVQRYVNGLGNRLARHSGRTGIAYHFKVIDRPEVNAFALPGGYIYVFRGVIQLSQNESELAGVLAHEIAHIAERHHIDQMRKAQYLGLGLGVLDILLGRQRGTAQQLGSVGANLFAQGVFFKFSRDAEREADRRAVVMLRRAGFDPRGMVTLFQRMESLQQRNPNLVEAFFSSHPRLSERQRNVSGVLQADDSRLRKDSGQFQAARRRAGGELQAGS